MKVREMLRIEGIIVLLAIVVWTTCAAKAEEIVCPGSISVEQQLMQPVDGWKASTGVFPIRFSGVVTFYNGDPKKMASLVPTKEGRIGNKEFATWDLRPISDSSSETWISCGYSGANVVLSRPLPKGVTECTVTYKSRTGPSNPDSVERISCNISQAQTAPKYRPREVIKLPDDCVFIAHDGDYETQADICAETVYALYKSIKNSEIYKQCNNDFFPDLEGMDKDNEAVLVAKLYEDGLMDRLAFLSLGKGRFLMKVMCTEGAYNEGTFLFAYDEAGIDPSKIGDSYGLQPAPPLIVFTTMLDDRHSVPFKGFVSLLNLRDYDPRSFTLYHFGKMLGDGSGGDYAEYRINPETFIPTLQRSIYKANADNKDPYNFDRGQLPRGKDWHSDDTHGAPAGCLVKLTQGTGKLRFSCPASPKPRRGNP
ncbi:MAG: STY0301 family protein [Terracidiphilus sp.]